LTQGNSPAHIAPIEARENGRLPGMVHLLLERDECVPLPKEEFFMAEQSSQPVPPTESTLALSFLREDIQDVRQDVRQTNERIDVLRTEMSGRIDVLRTEMSERIDALRTEMSERIDALRTEMNERIDQTNGRIDELGKQLDSRYARLMATLITCTGILVASLGTAVAVLK